MREYHVIELEKVTAHVDKETFEELMERIQNPTCSACGCFTRTDILEGMVLELHHLRAVSVSWSMDKPVFVGGGTESDGSWIYQARNWVMRVAGAMGRLRKKETGE